MHFKWRFFVIFIFVFFFFGFSSIEVKAQFAGGVGTSESPYQISNCTQLQNIGSSDSPGSFPYMDDYFILINNIDCSETETWNQDIGGTYFGFDPIYHYNNEEPYEEYFFSGFLDGQNFTIDGLYINRTEENDVALFGYISGSTIINLNLTNVDFTGEYYVGGIASYMKDTTIDNISVTGRLVSIDQEYGTVGGIAGWVYFFDYFSSEIIIDDCHFSGDINSGERAGGLFAGITLDEGVTDVFSATINNSSSSGLIDVGDSGVETGGLIGSNSFVNINNSNSSMDIDGGSSLGGLVGINESGEIENCYSTGIINGFGSDVGGLVGYNNNGGIFKSYSESQVSGNVYVGGLIGSNHNGHVENNYATGDVVGIVSGGLIGFNSINPQYGVGTIINSYASGTVTGTDTDGAVGGLIGYSSGDAIYNSYSVGEVLGVGGSGFGGFVGVFEYDVFLSQLPSDLLFNNGWYRPEDTLLNAIGILIESNSDTYEYNEIGSTSVPNEASDYTEFYSRSHQIYDVGVSFPWDFTTPIWYEWTNTYPLFIPQPLETPTPTPTLTPTPTGTVLGTTTNSSGGLPVCTDLPPVLAPNLFQITAEKNGARLYYTPIVGQVDGYTITYGYFEGDERWAVIAPVINNNQGVQSYRVGSLEAGKTYYFKVSAKHGCQVGPWSAWLSAKQGGVLAATSGVGELPKAGLIFPTIVLVLGSFISLLGIVILKSRT